MANTTDIRVQKHQKMANISKSKRTCNDQSRPLNDKHSDSSHKRVGAKLIFAIER